MGWGGSSSTSQPGPLGRGRRLNPFAFPSGTDHRFALLVVTVLSGTLFLYDGILPAGALVDAYRSCLARVNAAPPIGSARSLDDLGGLLGVQDRILVECRSGAERDRVEQEALGMAGVVGLALAIYALMPLWRRRRGGYVPLPAGEMPEIVAEIERLAADVGLRSPPRLLWNPLQGSATVIAFGAFGRHQLGLTGRLLVRFHGDREAFRAVLRHELAHIRNGDVDKTYLTIATWYAFVMAAVAPFLVVMAVRDPAFLVLGEGWRVAGLALIVYLLRNGVLRVRESYADVRASLADGGAAGLDRVLGQLPAPPRGWWGRLRAVHPAPADRRRLLVDTTPLFRVSILDTFALGVALALAFPNLALALYLWMLAFEPSGLLGALLAALLLSVLLVGILGSAVWRAAFLALATGRPPAPVLPLAIALAAGDLAGRILSFEAGVDGMDLGPSNLVVLASVELAHAAALAAASFALLRWIRAGAGVWLRRAGAVRDPRRSMVVGLAIAVALAAPWFAALHQARLLLEVPIGPEVLVLGGLVVALGGAIALGTPIPTAQLAAALAFLLAGLAARPAPGPAPRLRAALVAAVAGTAIYAAFCAPAMALWHVSGAGRASTDAGALAFFLVLIAAAALVQGYVAAAVVSGRSAPPAPLGMAAAVLSGLAMSAVLLTVNQVVGGRAAPGVVLVVTCLVVNGGALLSLLAVLLIPAPVRAADVAT